MSEYRACCPHCRAELFLSGPGYRSMDCPKCYGGFVPDKHRIGSQAPQVPAPPGMSKLARIGSAAILGFIAVMVARAVNEKKEQPPPEAPTRQEAKDPSKETPRVERVNKTDPIEPKKPSIQAVETKTETKEDLEQKARIDQSDQRAMAAKQQEEAARQQKEKDRGVAEKSRRDELSAKLLLSSAKQLAKDGKTTFARMKLRELLDNYPDTAQAKEANAMLKQITLAE